MDAVRVGVAGRTLGSGIPRHRLTDLARIYGAFPIDGRYEFLQRVDGVTFGQPDQCVAQSNTRPAMWHTIPRGCQPAAVAEAHALVERPGGIG